MTNRGKIRNVDTLNKRILPSAEVLPLAFAILLLYTMTKYVLFSLFKMHYKHIIIDIKVV